MFMAARHEHRFSMKHYIFLTSGIFEMGGAEMFTANKCKYLKSTGWDVRVFYYRKFGELKIQELAEYQENCIPELLFGFTYIPKNKRDKIISRICEGIQPGDEVVVESHIINLAYWGEMIAERCKGKSIVNAMEEKIAPFSDSEAAFVEFKLKRWEILNASEKSFKRYFNDRYKSEYANYVHKLMRAYCSNVTVKDDTFECGIQLADCNILSIGRLDKPYILPMFNEIKLFANCHSSKTINVLIIGGSPDGNVEQTIQNIFSEVKNVSLKFYGYLFPVPTKLLDMADVGIAMANSILVSSDYGIPTIAIDIQDLQPLGIFGRTTKNQFQRDKEPIQKISELLVDVLIDKKFAKLPPKEINVDDELKRVFSKQIDFLELSPKDHCYYDVLSVYPWYKYTINPIKKFIKDIVR